jgi:hypothetical protein
MVKRDPALTWDQVDQFDPAKLPKCQLFNLPAPRPLSGHPVTHLETTIEAAVKAGGEKFVPPTKMDG